MKFCFEYLQEYESFEKLCQSRKSLSFYFQTPRSWLLLVFFQRTYRCLEMDEALFLVFFMLHENKGSDYQV